MNPFAPAILPSGQALTLGDQTTIDGFFQSFSYSFNMKDTVVYSGLLAEEFIFTYKNYELGMDFSWTRSEDMLTTYKLFNAAQSLDFVWNGISTQSGDDTLKIVSRSFNLTINFNPSYSERFNGKVYFILKRTDINSNWMLTYWRDDSYYS